jgi:hypothetical protein
MHVAGAPQKQQTELAIYLLAGGGVGRVITSSGCRGTILPLASFTKTTSTTSLVGSANDDVFTTDMNDLSLFTRDRIEHLRANQKRASLRGVARSGVYECSRGATK